MAPIRPMVALCKAHLCRNPTGSLAEEQGAGPCGCGLVLTTGCPPPDPRPGDDAEWLSGPSLQCCGETSALAPRALSTWWAGVWHTGQSLGWTLIRNLHSAG